MGVAKQLLELDGVPLLVRTVDVVLDSRAHPVVVVLGADEERIRISICGRDVVVAPNPAWRAGLSTSIRAGMAAMLRAAPAVNAVLVTPCDQPALSSEIIVRLFDAHRSTGRIACARFNGRNASPAVFGRTHFHALQSLAGDQGARTLLNGEPGDVEAIDIPALEADLDTMDDYEKWAKGVPGIQGP
jgi:molybdenum cofactor cytidylyltransferase